MAEAAVAGALVALGDSITRGRGAPAFGLPARSWAAWLAASLGLACHNHASEGAVAGEVERIQLARVRGGYALGCLYVGVNDVRRPDWDPDAYAAVLERIAAGLARRCERLLLATVPRDLGRPRAGGKVGECNALIRAVAARHDAVVADLTGLRGRRLVAPDAVHLTALGQVAVADAAARALRRAGMGVPALPSELSRPDFGVRARLRAEGRRARDLARDLARRAREGTLLTR